MTVYCLSRHPGAIDWLREQGVQADVVLEHVDCLSVEPGDTVIGTLPLGLAATLCAAGAEVVALCLELPPEARGRELSAEQMKRYGARLRRFVVLEKDGTAVAGDRISLASING